MLTYLQVFKLFGLNALGVIFAVMDGFIFTAQTSPVVGTPKAVLTGLVFTALAMFLTFENAATRFLRVGFEILLDFELITFAYTCVVPLSLHHWLDFWKFVSSDDRLTKLEAIVIFAMGRLVAGIVDHLVKKNSIVDAK